MKRDRVCRAFLAVLPLFALVLTVALIGCGGSGGYLVDSGTQSSGSSGSSSGGSSAGFSDPSKAPSNNLVFDGTGWKMTSKQSSGYLTFIGEGDIKQDAPTKAIIRECSSCHTGIHAEYRTGDDSTSNRHGQNFRTAHGRNKLDSYGGSCRPCHTTGYDEGGYNKDGGMNTNLEGIQCESCHGPGSLHVAAAAGDRESTINTIPDAKQTCWACHVSSHRQLDSTVAPVTDADLASKSPKISVHHPQALLLNGVYGYEYAGTKSAGAISAHKDIANSCVTCHWQDNSTSSNTAHKDHSMTANAVDTTVCSSCHSNASQLMTEAKEHIEGLLKQLAGDDLDPDSDTGLFATYAAAHSIDTSSNSNPDDPYVKAYKGARHNFSFIEHDKSDGIHNYDYAKALLEGAVASLQ